MKRETIFTPAILYNLLSLSIEKYFMALSLFHGQMPIGHTFSGLLDSISPHLALSEDWVRELKYFESLQEICDLDLYIRKGPSREDIALMLEFSGKLQLLTQSLCHN